jgi:TolA-binding protein
VLGRGYTALQEHDRAAVCFLWLPLVDDHDTHLAARACVNAADSLKRIGQTAQAASLYREVRVRYAATPLAAEAAELLREGE